MDKKTETTRVLNAVERLFDKHLVMPTQEERDAAIVWTAATWVAEHFDNFPRIYFRAAEYGAGKTVAAEAVGRLTREFHDMVGATPSVLYRLIENSEKKPTIFLDEVDNIFGTAGSSSSHTELLGVLNKGFHQDGKVYRSRGQDDVKPFRCFAPMILAGKGILPKAMMTRSITVAMRRPVEGETYVAYRKRVHKPLFDAVRDALDKWAGRAARDIGSEFPVMPKGLKDRDIDVWEPLLMVADLASDSDWGTRIRDAAVMLSNRKEVKDLVPAGDQFAQALKKLFAESDRITQKQVAEELNWTPNAVGKMARGMEIHPIAMNIDGKTHQGFRKEQYDRLFSI